MTFTIKYDFANLKHVKNFTGSASGLTIGESLQQEQTQRREPHLTV